MLVYTDEHVGRREILNNYRLDVHADESNQHPVAGGTGSFITVPLRQVTSPNGHLITPWLTRMKTWVNMNSCIITDLTSTLAAAINLSWRILLTSSHWHCLAYD